MFAKIVLALLIVMSFDSMQAQTPPIEPGVSQELARWRAERYSDVRYKLNLTLEKMSPVLKGTMEIRVKVGAGTLLSPSPQSGEKVPIILDWRKIKGHEERSTISNVTVNGRPAHLSRLSPRGDKSVPAPAEEMNEHLIFRDGVLSGENVIKLDFTSPILTSGSSITRYIDKEDGSEYIYSLFVPSDASTAFPVFDQPDLKARFALTIEVPILWQTISNSKYTVGAAFDLVKDKHTKKSFHFFETQPISTYVFAFATGDFDEFVEGYDVPIRKLPLKRWKDEQIFSVLDQDKPSIYVRKSQAEKFKPHAAEVFRLNREGIKHLEQYFDYKFPFPKYDIVLIPEFPFGGMEHAGATFLRESSVIFPSEPTANDYISRANVIFHEAAHQWFGDTVTMRWFDDLWLKEGFAEFMAYKTLEKVMPEYNAWKVFYERNKQAAYLTDSTKGTTPIYQEIKNLNSAKSAYGNIVYRKAPSFLKQAEFYIGPDKFQTAVRAFLKKHEFGNAGWEDLVKEFETASNIGLQKWANEWVTQRGLPVFRAKQVKTGNKVEISIQPEDILNEGGVWSVKTIGVLRYLEIPEFEIAFKARDKVMFGWHKELEFSHGETDYQFLFPNYKDYGYGIFLLDDKSRDYVLKNIQNEKDDFLRTMMWGSLWDSVREGELDPKEYVELAIKHIGVEKDESTIQTIVGRVSTAVNYYMSVPPAVAGGGLTSALTAPPATAGGTDKKVPPATAGGTDKNGGGTDFRVKLEERLIERMQNSSTAGQRITYYRAFLNAASTPKARTILKGILKTGKMSPAGKAGRETEVVLALRTKDRFDIVTRLAILGDPDAPKLLADLEKSETSDEAKRYAYAAKAAFGTKETKAKYFSDFLNNKDISESWIEAAFVPFNSIRHAEMTQPYLERALAELPNLKRTRKIFFINGWLGAFIGGQRDEKALAIVNKFLADNPDLDKDLRLKILENVDVIERAVKIRGKYKG